MDEKQLATLDQFEKRLFDEKLTQDGLTDDHVQRDVVLRLVAGNLGSEKSWLIRS